ncbi:hypothetical protein RSJ42_18470 [Methanosarcina hadiensis]|uniref:hypothetical protein n=1 Tax=Methanosarcina hadiensis TaxID=3078083 RepID=UPI003977B801
MKRTSREWKQKRAEFIEGKVCAWCGSPDRLCVHTPGALSPAEIRSGIYDLAYARFKDVYRQKYQEFEYILTGKHRHRSHPAWHKASTIHKTEPDHTDLEEQRIEKLIEDKREGNFKQLYNEWLEENGIEELIEEEIKKAEEEYASLENAIVLCKRCHFASMKGMEICPVCRKKYKASRYETCFDCLPEEKKKDILMRKKEKRELPGGLDEFPDKSFAEES